MRKHAQDADLLAKINAAVAAANEAETILRAELVARSKTVGLLLLAAKKLHPMVKDFEAFLKKVQGLGLSRAYECMAVAGGRTTAEEIKKATRDRVAKHRARKKKLPGPTPAPEPQKLSVTKPDVTETPEASAERRKAEYAAEERAAEVSARCLAQFIAACRTLLPQISVEADRETARRLVAELTSGKPQSEAA